TSLQTPPASLRVASNQLPSMLPRRSPHRLVPTLRDSSHLLRSMCDCARPATLQDLDLQQPSRSRLQKLNRTQCSDAHRCGSDRSVWEENFCTTLRSHQRAVATLQPSYHRQNHPTNEVPHRVSITRPNRKFSQMIDDWPDPCKQPRC